MVQLGEKTDVDIRLEALRVAQGDLSKAKEIYEWLIGKEGPVDGSPKNHELVEVDVLIEDGDNISCLLNRAQNKIRTPSGVFRAPSEVNRAKEFIHTEEGVVLRVELYKFNNDNK